MKIYILPIIFLFLLIFGVDYSLAFYLKKFNLFFKRKGRKLIFWIIPVFLCFSYLLLIIIISKTFITDKWQQYFMLTNGLLTIIYIPKLITILSFFIIDSISFIAKKRNQTKAPSIKNKKSISRAQFLGMIGTISSLIPFSALMYNLTKGRFNFKIHHANININHLNNDLRSLRIVQLSDIHLGSFNNKYDQLENVMHQINELKPDLIVLTGDLVNNFASEADGWQNVFLKLKATTGKYAILGNHDYGDYSDWKTNALKEDNFNKIKQAYKKLGFTLLLNTNETVKFNNTSFSLIGVENWGHPPFPQYGDLQKSMTGDLDNFKILMTHDPDHWEAEVLKHTNIDLCLSGHTHGMQIGFKFKNKVWSPAKWKYKYWGGLYKNEEQYLYVNRGLGFIGIPFRIGMPPEITLLTFNSHSQL